MKKILLIYPPFCTPTTPPYSITNIQNFLKRNLSQNYFVKTMDLNIEFHKLKFSQYKKYFTSLKQIDKTYRYHASNYLNESKKTYSENNKLILNNQKPELFDKFINKIKRLSPDIVAFSLVYSSQVFYTYALIKELKRLGVKTIVGGEAVSKVLSNEADHYLKNELELLNYINKKNISCDKLDTQRILDFSQYNQKDYFTPKTIIPLKSSNTCYYRKCAFCTHHKKERYYEYCLEDIKKTILLSKSKYFFFIDDMISKKRLLEIAKIIKPLNVSWTCQLKPINSLDKKTIRILYESGLKMVMWGIESGNQRVLDLMNKGTILDDMSLVLKNSHDSGIKNVGYILFGFPTETKKEFNDTINFLKNNKDYIDLISISIFGLQKDSDVFLHPEKYSVYDIKEIKRTLLDPKIEYKLYSGITFQEAFRLKKENYNLINSINKYPSEMNFFREHMFILLT